MAQQGGVISYPIPLYANVPIHAEYYEPSRFVITAITRGQTTTVTTSVAHNYVIGQEVRLLIPRLYGASQLNKSFGLVLSIPSTTQVEIDIDSSFANAFIPNPLTATITAATQANPAVLTATNSFLTGNSVIITAVGGMTQLNGFQFQVTRATATTLTLNVNSSSFGAYTSGGIATLVTREYDVPQILAIGDINEGVINAFGRSPVGTYIPGSFIDIS